MRYTFKRGVYGEAIINSQCKQCKGNKCHCMYMVAHIAILKHAVLKMQLGLIKLSPGSIYYQKTNNFSGDQNQTVGYVWVTNIIWRVCGSIYPQKVSLQMEENSTYFLWYFRLLLLKNTNKSSGFQYEINCKGRVSCSGDLSWWILNQHTGRGTRS